jgi:hypothetical protein
MGFLAVRAHENYEKRPDFGIGAVTRIAPLKLDAKCLAEAGLSPQQC